MILPCGCNGLGIFIQASVIKAIFVAKTATSVCSKLRCRYDDELANELVNLFNSLPFKSWMIEQSEVRVRECLSSTIIQGKARAIAPRGP